VKTTGINKMVERASGTVATSLRDGRSSRYIEGKTSAITARFSAL
jgi:hypothetical protein